MQLCIYNQIWNLETLHFEEKKPKNLPYADLLAGGKSEPLKATGHVRVSKTQLLGQDGEKEKQGLCRPAKQLIIGSYYWGTVSGRREVRFQAPLKTLMVQNRPHYRDIISIHTLTELLGCLLGKIRFLHLRTSSLGAWLTEQCAPHTARLDSAQRIMLC